jgi:hypothetical protein
MRRPLNHLHPNRAFAAQAIGGFRRCYAELVSRGPQNAAITLPALLALSLAHFLA